MPVGALFVYLKIGLNDMDEIKPMHIKLTEPQGGSLMIRVQDIEKALRASRKRNLTQIVVNGCWLLVKESVDDIFNMCQPVAIVTSGEKAKS